MLNTSKKISMHNGKCTRKEVRGMLLYRTQWHQKYNFGTQSCAESFLRQLC